MSDSVSLASAMLAEFQQEARTTRKFLERVPEDKLGWKPHEKSMSAGQLALHIATAPAGVIRMVSPDESAPPNLSGPNPQPKSVAEILAALEQSVAIVESTLPTFTDERMRAIWRLKADGKELLAIPRVSALRSILLNHWYHHRGQFGVYLRLLGAKVPSAYGPSGDEPPEFMQK